MKKEIPQISKIIVPYERNILEDILLFRFNIMIKEGFTFPFHDFDLYCAIRLRKESIECLPKILKDYIIQDRTNKNNVLFQMIALAMEKNEFIGKDDMNFFVKENLKKAIERKNIVKNEIKRTGLNPSKVSLKNLYYKELLNVIKDFSDITLLDWYIPIVLTFEKFVHIYVKHVEETKFNDGQFKRRSFFDYKHTLILTLLKKIIQKENQEIKDHFLNVSAGFECDEITMIKDYHRGFGKFPPIMLGDDKFRLSINKYGFIDSFYQIK